MYDEKIIEDSLEFCRQIRIYREADQKRKENLSFVEKIGKQYEEETKEIRNRQAEHKPEPAKPEIPKTEIPKSEILKTETIESEPPEPARVETSEKETLETETPKTEIPKAEPVKTEEVQSSVSTVQKKEKKPRLKSARNISGVNLSLLGEEQNEPDPAVVKAEVKKQEKEKRKRPTSETPMLSFVNNILLVLICVLVGFLAASLITHFCIYETRVEGSSMEPALSDRDHVFIEKLSYRFHDPKRFEIVVFPVSIPKKDSKKEETSYYVKRIIGLPGETVQIQDGNVYINGRKLTTDTYRLSEIMDPGIAGNEIKLGEDEYFVLGDNRNLSTDSRSEYVGAIKKDNIDGRVVFRIWPFSRIGKIKDN